MRHIAYGDERGTPGSIVTFFDMPGVVRGRPGSGMLHRLVLRVADDEALDFWEGRLGDASVASDRRAHRLVFADPEGLQLELMIDDRADQPLIAAAPDVDEHGAIRGLHAVRAYAAGATHISPVIGEVLGMEHDGDESWLVKGERRHGHLVYDEGPSGRGMMSAGSMHHVAFTISDGDENAWREHLAAAGLRPTLVLDRRMFKSIYFRGPGGVLFELATEGPGFVFESPDRLGESLVLIGDLESRRKELERRFPVLPNPRLPA